MRLLALVLVLLTGTVGSAATAALDAGPAHDAKKRCKIVKKKVHGHIKRVRVCTKPKPKPVKSVSLQLDTAHAVTKPIVAADGGSVTTTAGNGTKLTLTIPRDGLVADKTVTVTPVTALAGLPKGSRFFGGVQLAPEGAGLLKDATLTIETPAAPSAKHLRAVGWQGEGKSPFPYKATRTGSAVQVKVIHFSGAGAGDMEGWASLSLAFLRGTYPQVRQDMVAATTTDSVAFARGAIERWLAWDRQVELIFGEDLMASERKELREDLLPKVIKNMIEKSYARCRNQHNVVEELAFLGGLQRQSQLLGLDALDALAKQRQEKCGTFELDFESVITWQASAGKAASDVRTHGLELGPKNEWTNEQALEYVSFDFLPGVDPSPCTLATSKQVDEPFHAKIVSLGSAPTPEKPNPNIVVEIDTGKVSETITISCPMNVVTTGHPAYWSSGIAVLHGLSRSFTIADWEYAGTALFARKTFTTSQPTGDGTVSEQTTFDLRHTPE